MLIDELIANLALRRHMARNRDRLLLGWAADEKAKVGV
jgi:hypothetical protein